MKINAMGEVLHMYPGSSNGRKQTKKKVMKVGLVEQRTLEDRLENG